MDLAQQQAPLSGRQGRELDTALYYVLAVVLLTYLGSLIGFDRFHSEIGAVTRQFKKP
jgi:hypothetical protein